MNKAARILRLRETGKLEIGDKPFCPHCGRRNCCLAHNYAYRKWLENTLPYLEIEAGI